MDTLTRASPMTELRFRINNHLRNLYPHADIDSLCDDIMAIMDFGSNYHGPQAFQNHWDETDIAVITYADTIIESGRRPLCSLKDFFCRYLGDIATIVHVLPFYPYSSDDGFAVVDYLKVEERLGSWEDIGELTRHFKLMADLVINHCSSQSPWFLNFLENKDPGRDYFVTAELNDDLSQVVRPRTSPLLKKVAPCLSDFVRALHRKCHRHQ